MCVYSALQVAEAIIPPQEPPSTPPPPKSTPPQEPIDECTRAGRDAQVLEKEAQKLEQASSHTTLDNSKTNLHYYRYLTGRGRSRSSTRRE